MRDMAEAALFVLPWWTYVCLAVTVFLTVLVTVRVDSWIESLRGRQADFPCLVHTGTDPMGLPQYCGLLEGHKEPHGDVVIDTYALATEAPLSAQHPFE